MAHYVNIKKQACTGCISYTINNFGGCLADDMGLGKTLQTIALLLLVKNDANSMASISDISNQPGN